MQLNTPDWLDKYKELVASSLSQRQACAILGIARATVYDTLKKVENPPAQKLQKVGMRVLLLDLETAPTLAYVWRRWKQNIGSNQIEREGSYMLTAAWKWLGEDDVHCAFANDPVNGDDSNICALLYEAIEQSDVVVAHNLNGFD